MWAAIIGLGAAIMNWNAAQDAEDAQMSAYNYQRRMAERAIAELRADQKRWDSIVPDLQAKLERFSTGQFTPGEAEVRRSSIRNLADPVITETASSINKQAAASKEMLTSDLGARGMAQAAPGIVTESLAGLEAKRTGAIGGATRATLAEATTAYDQNAQGNLRSLVSSYGQRPSVAGGYSSASSGVRAPQPVSADFSMLGEGLGAMDESMNALWGGLKNLFKKKE